MLDYSRFENGIEGPLLLDYILSLQYTVAPESAGGNIQMPYYGYNFINKKKDSITLSSQLPNTLKNTLLFKLSPDKPTVVFLASPMIEPSYAAAYTQALVGAGAWGLYDNGKYCKPKRMYIEGVRVRVPPYNKVIPIK